jgi:hypothetical protein
VRDALVLVRGHRQHLEAAVAELDQLLGAIRQPEILVLGPVALPGKDAEEQFIQGTAIGRSPFAGARGSCRHGAGSPYFGVILSLFGRRMSQERARYIIARLWLLTTFLVLRLQSFKVSQSLSSLTELPNRQSLLAAPPGRTPFSFRRRRGLLAFFARRGEVGPCLTWANPQIAAERRVDFPIGNLGESAVFGAQLIGLLRRRTDDDATVV